MRYLLMGLFVGLAGCASMRVREARQRNYDEMMSFVGKPKDAFVENNGAPTSCAALDTGGEVCTWAQFLSVSRGAAGLYGQGHQLYGGASSVGIAGERRVIVTFDKEHIARHWTIKAVNNYSYGDGSDRNSL